MKTRLSLLIVSSIFSINSSFADPVSEYTPAVADRYELNPLSYITQLSVDYRFHSNQTVFNEYKLGIEGQTIYSIASQGNNNTIYVGTNKGILISLDGGATFSPSGLKNTHVNSVVVDSNNVIYAGTQTKGLLISKDGGKTFNRANLNAILVTSIFVMNNGTIYVGSWGGVAISKDGGETFANFTSGLANNLLSSIFVDKDGTIYAGIIGRGVFISTDAGVSFSNLNETIFKKTLVKSLFVDENKNIYVGTLSYNYNKNPRKSGNLFVSRDNGITYTALLNEQQKGTISSIFVDKDRTIYAGKENNGGGILISTDAGISFTTIAGTLGSKIYCLFAKSSGSFYAGSKEKLLKY